MKPRRKGKIIPNGVVLETHENATVVYFTELGFDIDLIVPSRTPGQKSADFMMDGIAWEMKCPMWKSQTTIDHMFQKAVKQSGNVVIDLRNTHADEKKALVVINKRYKQMRTCRRLKVITKTGGLLEFNK